MKDWLYDILLIAVGVLFGLIGTIAYLESGQGRLYDGLTIFDSTESAAEETAQIYDPFGDWICVNVNGMTPKRMIEVCNHEAGHEIFAEMCEDDISKCLNLTK